MTEITTVEELDALPVGSVAVCNWSNVEFHKTRTGKWIDTNGSWWSASEMCQDDAEYTLHRPDVPVLPSRESAARQHAPTVSAEQVDRIVSARVAFARASEGMSIEGYHRHVVHEVLADLGIEARGSDMSPFWLHARADRIERQEEGR